MSFKPFFHHYNRGAGYIHERQQRGFTMYIRPLFPQEIREAVLKHSLTPDEAKHRLIATSAVFCAAADAFVKAEGRIRAEADDIKIINKRDLPKYVAATSDRCSWSLVTTTTSCGT
jgi:hypothetical protein